MECEPSTILPNNRCTALPILPTDGQKFVDAQMVQWIYDGAEKVWERRGVADNIPIATSEQAGLLSPQDKNLINMVPAVGGGFGIITDAKLLLKSPTNPEGVITGDIKLKSDSLDIVCVGPNKLKIDCNVQDIIEGADPDNLPGLAFSLNDAFINTLFVDACGPKGKKGYKGSKGYRGKPGYSEGPIGNDGLPGESIDELCVLDSIQYRDINGITDTAIVKMDIVSDKHGCKLIVTKSKTNIEEDRAADKLAAGSLSRSVAYKSDTDAATCDVSRLDDWDLIKLADDTTSTNLHLLRIPKNSNASGSVGFSGTLTLKNFVEQIVAKYKERLVKTDKEWGNKVKKYINGLDDKARGILSGLANELSMCEFNLPAVEYCITFTGCDSGSPIAAAAGSAVESTNAAASTSIFNVGQRTWNIK